MRGYKYGWNPLVIRLQAQIELWSGHSRQPHVQYQAVELVQMGQAQELFGRAEERHVVSDRLNEPDKRLAHGFIIIHNPDLWRSWLVHNQQPRIRIALRSVR